MFDARTNLSSEVAAEVRRHLGSRVYETVIPRSVRLSEAPSHGLPIHLYAPTSKGAEAYAALASEIRARDGRTTTGALTPGADDGATGTTSASIHLQDHETVLAGAVSA
jgi:nitrogenase subunit NifH